MGKDPARFIEDMIYYFRDMLLYQAAPSLADTFERVLIDPQFKELAEIISTDTIYSMIESFNKAQQDMKWTNHPRILLEVALVKLCNEQSSASGVIMGKYNSLFLKSKAWRNNYKTCNVMDWQHQVLKNLRYNLKING